MLATRLVWRFLISSSRSGRDTHGAAITPNSGSCGEILLPVFGRSAQLKGRFRDRVLRVAVLNAG